MPSSYTRLKDDDESAGKIINAIIALIMELPCFIFIENVGYDATGRKKDGSELPIVSEKIRNFISKQGW